LTNACINQNESVAKEPVSTAPLSCGYPQLLPPKCVKTMTSLSMSTLAGASS
jgi:hypothetical protein